ncbi:hypothetical protein JKF63_02906 [Porcisia hertigi]|uniref:Uncharacterized protein n=1 Tax=Porcisia hertigi TaxID=2761500 RepID=A0A836L881_9TRYP|nr:hypothetical protein JKF63_02906 [Porcisia hertigi]
MLSVAPFVGSPAGVATVQHFTGRDADGSSSHGGAVVSPHICTSSCLPRGNNYIRAHGDPKAVLTPFAVTHRSANGTEDEKARAHGDTSKSPSAVRTASWMTRNATESASAGAEARTETTITLALGSSQLPARSLNHLVNRLPSSITSLSSSSVARSARDSVDVDAAAAAAHIPRVPPSPPPVTSSDDCGLRSISSPNGAAPTPAERHWVPYDVYLSLSAPLLHDRVLQDRVATLCCPMTLSGDDHSQLVNIHSVLPFLLHGNAVAPPIALATARVTRASTPQSSMQSFSPRSGVPGSLSDEAQRAAFPLFCVLGAKSCTVSRRTRSICSIHTPKVPIAERFCVRPDQHSGGGSHTRNSSDKAALPYPAVQQHHAVKSSSGVETVSPRREGCSDDVLLLFTEQLTGVIPTFPVELLYTTSPTGAIVSAPPAEYTAYWDSWQQTPRAVRRRASYDSIWSVVTLPRLVVMLQRWGVSPAMAMRRLCVRPPGCSTLPLEPTGGSHPLPTTVDAVPREGRGATAVAAVPGALGASRRLQLSLAESSSCLFASPSSLRTGASAQLTREDAVGSQQHTVGLTINGGVLSDSLSSDAGATPESDMCAPSMGGTAAMMSTGSERAAPVECDTCGVTMPGSPGVLLSSSLRGDTDSSLHPYNASGASDFVNIAADGNRSLHGQAHLYDVPSPPPPPPVALSAPKSFGSVALLRAAVLGVPLRRSSTPSFHHQRSQYQHLLKSALQLRLPICLSRTCANGCRRHTKNVPALHPRHCRGTTGHMAVVPPSTSDRNCDVLAHPYAMPTSEEAWQPGIKSRRGRKGRETRHSRHSIRNQETNARDTSAERADATDALEQTRGSRGGSVRQIAAGDFTVHEKAASDAVAPPPPPPTPTPPTRDGAQYRLDARQRTEHVKKYLQALMSAAAHRRAEPMQRAADDTSQQSLQCSAHRCSTSEHIATTKERTPLHPTSGCSCAGVNPERSLNHGRGSADGGSAGMRRVPMPPSSPRQHQLHLYSPPHTNIAHDHSESICTQRSVDSRTVSGERDSAALGDPAADFSTAPGIEQTYLCNDARTKVDAASSTFVGDSMIPSMSASSEGSLASLATVSAVSPAAHAPHHPKPVSDVHSNSCTADHVDRHGAEGSQSTFFTASSPSSTLASLQVLRQLASPLQSMRTCRLHRNSRLSGPPMLACLRENSDDCPRACVPPELSSPPLSCHPTLYLPTGPEEPGAAVAVSLRHGGYHNAGTTVSPLPADVLLPPRPQSPTLRAPSEGVTLYNAAVSSADHLPLGPRHDSDSAVRHVPVESASAGKSALSVSDLSLPKGGTSNMQPLRANRNGSGEPRLHVAEQTVPNHPRLHTLVSGHTDSAHNEAMPGSVRHDCTDARPASTFVPPVSPDHQPSGASPDPNPGSADALAASTFHDDAEWPTFLPSSLLGSTLAITTYFSSDADDPTPAASLLPGADSESISPRAGTAALLVNLAACVIQAVGRGYITRRVLRRSSQRASSDPIECAVAVAPSVMHSPYPTLARLNSVFTSSTTVFAGVASASSSGRYHGVATSQGCPPPPLIGFSAPLASPVISTAMTATTIPKDARLSAHGFSVGEMMPHRPALRRCSAASQTSPISDKICASLHSAAAERSYPNKLVRVSEVGPKHSTSFSDTDSPKGSSASLLQHLFTTCERQKGSTGEDIGTPAPACVSGAAGLPIVSPNEGDATAIADVDACPPAVADSPLSAMPNYTACATLEVVPLGLRSDVSSGHKPPNLSTRCGDSAGEEPGDAATRTAGLVAGELFAAFAASTLPRRAMSPKVSSICEGAASSASHGSTEGWMSTLQPRFSGNPSCTMAFFDQAVAKGPSRKSKKCESHRPTLSNDDPHSSRRLSSSPHGDATFMVVDALLQLQRIGRGFLIRQQCKQRYWEQHEERSLDLLLQRVLLQAPIPFPGAAAAEEDVDTASRIDGKNAGSGVSAVASILTGVSSTSSSSTTGGQITTTASLPSSMPSASRASPLLATTMIPGHHQHPSPVDGQRVLCSPSHASPLFPEETIFSGSEDAAGIPAGDAPLSEDRSPTAALCSKTVPMLVTPDNTNYIVAPALASPNQRTSVLLTSPLSNMTGLALPSDASRPFRGGVGSGAVGASFKCQEARVTGAFCGGYTSCDSVRDAVTVGGSRSCDDDTAVAPPLVPSLTVSLPSTAASPLEDATKSGDTAHTLAIRSPSPPRLMLLSPPSLRVSFPRCSYPSPGSFSTVGTPGSAAPVTCTLGVLIPLPMSLSGTKSASCNEGTRPVLSPHRSPPSYFALQRPLHNDVASTVVERNNTSVCHAPRRRYFAAAAAAAAAAAGAELSPMDGSIFATSGRSARSLNSMNSLPFSFSVTANAMSVTGQNFSTPLSEGLALQPWVLDGVQIVSTFSSDCDSSDNEAVEQETTSSSSSSSDNRVACNDTEGDPLKRDLICVEEAGAEPACFGAAVQILGHEAAPPSMSKALLLLQRIGRGYLCRRRQHFIFMVSISWAEIALVQRVALGFLSRKRLGLEYFVHCEAKRQMSYWELRNRSAVLMQSVVRGFIGRQRAKRLQRRVFTRIELLAAGEQLYTD